jgi:hypothetical protein
MPLVKGVLAEPAGWPHYKQETAGGVGPAGRRSLEALDQARLEGRVARLAALPMPDARVMLALRGRLAA